MNIPKLIVSTVCVLLFTFVTENTFAINYPDKKYLVSSELKQETGKEELKKQYAPAAAYIINGYKAYRITYRTTNYDGKKLVASGAVFIPDVARAFPLLNYNHGTYSPSKEPLVPGYVGTSDELIFGKLFSGGGYLVVMPDYVGYGSSKNEKHPYGAYSVIASTVIDMLHAVREFCDEEKIQLNGKNFYSGWSEGAAVSMATVKLLEEKHDEVFKPRASILNAGPYYTTGFLEHLLAAKEPLRYLASYAWILRSYTDIYQLGKPLDWYFREPYASDLAKAPERYPIDDPTTLFTTTFLQNYRAGKESALADAMKKNDLWDWKPASKIVLCHGDKDDYVPLFNSEKAYNEMKSRGADVELHIYKNKNHSNTAVEFIRQLFTTMEAMK